MYTVSFVGLNYFHACKVGDREALIPNGTPGSGKDDDQLPPHFASLFIEEDQCEAADWWPDQKYVHPIQLEIKIGEFRTVNVIEFRLPPKPKPKTKPVQVRFPCNARTLRNLNLDAGLPRLQKWHFVLDDHPDAIAKVPLPGGDLEVFRFGGSTLVRWQIEDHDDPITITASDDRLRWVRLKKSDGVPPEIVFSNTIDLLPHAKNGGNGQPAVQSDDQSSGGGRIPGMHDGMAMGGIAGDATNGGMHHHHGRAGHFVLFAKLDKDRSEEKLQAATADKFPNAMKLRPAAFSHPYLAYLSSMRETPEAQCSGSCC